MIDGNPTDPSVFYATKDDAIGSLVADPDSKVATAIDARVAVTTLTEDSPGSGFYTIGA